LCATIADFVNPQRAHNGFSGFEAFALSLDAAEAEALLFKPAPIILIATGFFDLWQACHSLAAVFGPVSGPSGVIRAAW